MFFTTSRKRRHGVAGVQTDDANLGNFLKRFELLNFLNFCKKYNCNSVAGLEDGHRRNFKA